MNHVVGDGTSFWHFWNTWSYIHQKHSIPSNLPQLERWFPGHGPKITLPYTDTDEFVSRYEAPQLRQRIFHFSSDSISNLKVRANMEVGESDMEISSLQALSALLWRSITRARRLSGDQKVVCTMDANLRQRLNPQLPQEYFGNSIWVAKATAKSDELLEKGLGSAAKLLKNAVSDLMDRTVRGVFESWMAFPFVYRIDGFFEPNSVVIGSSPRFDVFGNEFGLGTPVAVLSGYANKFPGKVTAYPGRKRGRSIDLEVCLLPDEMGFLESDEEFLAVVTNN